MQSPDSATAAVVAAIVAAQNISARESEEQYQSLKVDYDRMVQQNAALQQQVEELQEQLRKAQMLLVPPVWSPAPVAARPAQVTEWQGQIRCTQDGPAPPLSPPSSQSSGAIMRAWTWPLSGDECSSAATAMGFPWAITSLPEQSLRAEHARDRAGQSNQEKGPTAGRRAGDPAAVIPISPLKRLRIHEADAVNPSRPQHTHHGSDGSASGGNRPEATMRGHLAAGVISPGRDLVLLPPSAPYPGRPQGALRGGRMRALQTASRPQPSQAVDVGAQAGIRSWFAPARVPQCPADGGRVHPRVASPPMVLSPAASVAGQAQSRGREAGPAQLQQVEGHAFGPSTGQLQESAPVPHSFLRGHACEGDGTAGIPASTEASAANLAFLAERRGQDMRSLDPGSGAEAHVASNQLSLSDKFRVIAAILALASAHVPDAELSMAPSTSPGSALVHLEDQPSGNGDGDFGPGND